MFLHLRPAYNPCSRYAIPHPPTPSALAFLTPPSYYQSRHSLRIFLHHPLELRPVSVVSLSIDGFATVTARVAPTAIHEDLRDLESSKLGSHCERIEISS